MGVISLGSGGHGLVPSLGVVRAGDSEPSVKQVVGGGGVGGKMHSLWS